MTRDTGTGPESIGSPAVVVVTDTRLLFITPDTSEDDAELGHYSVRYDELECVVVDDEETTRLRARTLDDVGWETVLPNADPEVLESLSRHLHWVGRIRKRLVGLQNRMDDIAKEIREEAREMNWDESRATYREARNAIDELILAVQLTAPISDSVLAPELSDIERTLEDANVRLYIERAQSQLELGRYLVEHENYDRASEVLERARRLHLQAEGQSDAVRREDAFQFGRQRDLSEEVERLGWDIDALASEPVRQAQEARVHARETNDARTAVEYWETAFQRYDRMLDLDWLDRTGAEADETDDVEGARDEALEQLVEQHRTIGEESLAEAENEHDEGNTAEALARCEEADEHFSRARNLVLDFELGGIADIETWLTRVSELEDSIRNERGDSSESNTNESTDTADPDHGESEADDTGGEGALAAELGTELSGSDDNSGEDDTEAEANDGEAGTNDADTGLETDTPELEATGGAAEAASLRFKQSEFLDDEPDTGEWIPASKSDIAEIETPHELTFDLDEIGLPKDVSAGGNGNGDGE